MNLRAPIQLLRSSRGAFDLPSIITAVIVVGILVAGVLGAVFGVIPWSQDEQAKGNLSAVRTAEGTHVAKDKGFVDLAGLQSARYLPSAVERLSVAADAAGTCYMGVAKSQTGKVFYSTDKANEPREMTPATTATPAGSTLLPCLNADAVQTIVDDVGGYDPGVYKPIGDGAGTTVDPGTGVKNTEQSATTAEPNAAVNTADVTVADRNLTVSFQNTSSTATTVRYGGRITCYDPSRNTATVEDIDGYFDLNSNIFADMTLVACTPGTQVVDIEFRPYDATYTASGSGYTGAVFRWRAPVTYSQATWVSRGLTASYDGNWCIENQGNAATVGNPIKLAHCASIDAQRWQWNGDGEIRQSTLNHKCAAATTDKMVLGDCSATSGQVFVAKIFQGRNSEGGLVQIIDKATGKCVDVPGGSLAAVQLTLAACNGTSTQSWYMPGLAASLDPSLQQPEPGATVPVTPTNVSATAYPATTANFKWDATPGATGYRVEYRVNGGAWTLKAETQTANSTSVTGSPNDTVDVRVTAKNIAGESPSGTGSFQLPGLSVLNGGFEQGMVSWTPGGNLYGSKNAGGHGGAFSAMLGGLASTDSSMSQTIQVAADGTSTLSFWYLPKSNEPGCACDWTEAQIRDASGALLRPIFKGNANSASWINKTVDLTPYRGQAISLWFNVHNDSAITTASYFDDVAVTNNLSTAPEAPVQVEAIRSGGSADVSWKQVSDGGAAVTSSTVTPLIDGVAQSPIKVTGNQTSTTVTGLAGGTYYSFAVTATNSTGTSSASVPSTPIRNGDFENALASWTTGGSQLPWASAFGTTTGRNGSATVFLGNQVSTDSNISQAIQVPESGTSTLSFWYQPHSAEPGCACDWTEAQIRDASGALLKPIFKGNNNTSTWLNPTADLTPYRGQTVTLWINVHNDSSNLSYTNVDDVSVTSGPALVATAPEDVTAVRTGDTAEVSWKQPSDGGAWVTTYTVTPWVNGVAQTPILVTGTPAARSVTVPGLTAGTNYSFTVTATNTVGTSAPSASSTTLKNGGFENGLAGWTVGGGQTPAAVFTPAHTGAKAVFLGNMLSSDSSIAQTIEIPATGTTAVSFWHQPHSGEPGCGCDYTELQILDGTTGALLKQAYKYNGNTSSWLNINIDLTAYKGKNVTLRFNMHNDSSILSYAYLDDIKVTTTG